MEHLKNIVAGLVALVAIAFLFGMLALAAALLLEVRERLLLQHPAMAAPFAYAIGTVVALGILWLLGRQMRAAPTG